MVSLIASDEVKGFKRVLDTRRRMFIDILQGVKSARLDVIPRLNPFIFRAELLLRCCFLLRVFNELDGAFSVSSVFPGLVFASIASQAENGLLAKVQPLAKMEGRQEGAEFSGEFPGADHAAQLHGLLLAGGAAGPVLPVQLFFSADALGEAFQFGKVPARRAGAVEFAHQAGAAKGSHEQGGRFEPIGR